MFSELLPIQLSGGKPSSLTIAYTRLFKSLAKTLRGTNQSDGHDLSKFVVPLAHGTVVFLGAEESMHEDDWVVDGLCGVWWLMEVIGQLHWRRAELAEWTSNSMTSALVSNGFYLSEEGRRMPCLRIRRIAIVHILYQAVQQTKQTELIRGPLIYVP